MHFKNEKDKVECELEIDPQPHQSFVGSFFRSKKACGYVPDVIKVRFMSMSGCQRLRYMCFSKRMADALPYSFALCRLAPQRRCTHTGIRSQV